MAEQSRMSATKDQLVRLPLEKKKNAIEQIYIRYGQIPLAWSLLQNTTVGRGASATSYIIGHSRSGKTETVKRYIRDSCGKRPEKGKPYQLIEGNGRKIIYADLTNGATPLVATQELLLGIFGDIRASKLKQATAAPRLVEIFTKNGVDQFVIDETQQMFNGHGTGAAEKLGAWALSLENAAAFSTVMVGDPRLLDLFRQVPALNERHRGIAYLEPFSFDDEMNIGRFADFVARFAGDLPFRITCLTDSKGRTEAFMLHRLYYATRGVQGALSRLTIAATTEAYKRAEGANVEILEMVDFADGFNSLLKHDYRMGGINPFSVSNVKELPTIKLTPQDAEDERMDDLQPRRRRKSNPKSITGGRILGR